MGHSYTEQKNFYPIFRYKWAFKFFIYQISNPKKDIAPRLGFLRGPLRAEET